MPTEVHTSNVDNDGFVWEIDCQGADVSYTDRWYTAKMGPYSLYQHAAPVLVIQAEKECDVVVDVKASGVERMWLMYRDTRVDDPWSMYSDYMGNITLEGEGENHTFSIHLSKGMNTILLDCRSKEENQQTCDIQIHPVDYRAGRILRLVDSTTYLHSHDDAL